MFGLFAVVLLFSACNDDDEKVDEKNGLELAKAQETIDSKAAEISIDAINEVEWWVESISVMEGKNEPVLIENTAKADTLTGEWYKVIRQEDGKALILEATENEGEERKIEVALIESAEAGPVGFTLTQKAKEGGEEEGKE